MAALRVGAKAALLLLPSLLWSSGAEELFDDSIFPAAAALQEAEPHATQQMRERLVGFKEGSAIVASNETEVRKSDLRKIAQQVEGFKFDLEEQGGSPRRLASGPPECNDPYPNWKDKDGRSCWFYAVNDYCKRDGRRGAGWPHDGGFYSTAVGGITADRACCACGACAGCTGCVNPFPLEEPQHFDEFAKWGCTHIQGNLLVRPTTQPTNLDALAKIETISGSLAISGHVPSLQVFGSLTSVAGVFYIISLTTDSTRLQGLENLTSIGGSFVVRDCHACKSLEGLESLEYVAGSFSLLSSGFTSLHGLTSLRSVGYTMEIWGLPTRSLAGLSGISGGLYGYLRVEDCPNVETLDGLQGITSLGNWGGRSLYIADMPNLRSVDAVQNAVRGHIAGGLVLGKLPSLSSFAPFEVITSVGATLMLNDLQPTDLHGLHNIRSIGGDLLINKLFTPNLTGLEGLRTIGGQLWIQDSQKLRSLDGLALQSVGGRNGPSIRLRQLLELVSLEALASLTGPLTGSLELHSLTSLRSLEGLHGLTSLGLDSSSGRSLTLDTVTALESVKGLRGLQGHLPGNFFVFHMPELKSFDGLQNITSCVGMSVGSTNMETFEGLNSLTSLSGGNFALVDNPKLRTIEALGGLSGRLGTAIRFRDLPVLASFFPLRNITQVGSGSSVCHVEVLRCDSLRDLSGFSGLQGSVLGGLSVEYNANLRSLQGLEGVKQIGVMKVVRCPELRTLAALGGVTVVGPLIILGFLPRIESLHGLDGVVRFGTPTHCPCIRFNHWQDWRCYAVTSGLEIKNCERLRSIASLGSMSGSTKVLSIHGSNIPSMQGIEKILAQNLHVKAGSDFCVPEAKALQLETLQTTTCSGSWGSGTGIHGHMRSEQPASTGTCVPCDPPCGRLPNGRMIECDERRGECRCPLGTTGPGCLEDAPRLNVVPSQSFDCFVSGAGGAGDHNMTCNLRASLAMANFDGNSTAPVRLSVYTDSQGDGQTAHPRTTAVQGEEYEAVTTGNVTWQNESYGEISVQVKLRRKSAYDGERKILRLFVGYEPDRTPDAFLDGTVLDGPLTSPSPRIYPWCLPIGAGCRLTAPESFEVGFRMNGGRLHFMSTHLEAKEDQEVAVAVLRRVGGNEGMVWAAVMVDLAATTAIPGVDFQFEREVVYWADGDSRDRAVLVKLKDNTVWEPSKTLVLTIAKVSHEHQRGATDQFYNITLLDDGDGGTLRFHSSGSIREDAGNASDCLVTVERAAGNSGSASVQVVLESREQLCGVSGEAAAVADSPALARGAADFSFAPGQRLTWADGEDGEKCVFNRAGGARLTVYGDWTAEENEALCLRLEDPAGTASVESSAANAIVTITDGGAGGDKGSYLTCDRGACSCAPGWYANGSAVDDQCWRCEPGNFCEGGWKRAPCRPGSFAATGGATACDSCVKGMYEDRVGRDSCSACPKGTFSNSSGSSSCTSCSSVWGLQGFTTVGEATSAASCACPPDHYLPCAGRHCPAGAPPPDGGCVPCPKGFSCKGGLERFEEVLKQSAGQAGLRRLDQLAPQTWVHAEPLLEPGAFASKDLPYCAIKCGAERGAERCPGLRRPGICGGPHRNNDLACSGCENGYYSTGGKCAECDQSFLSVVPLILGVPCALIALTLVAHVVNLQQAKQRHAMVAMSATLSIGLFSMQALGSFSKLAIDWIEPAKMLLSAFKDIFNLNDMKILQVECVVDGNVDLAAYLTQLLVTPAVLLLALVVVAVRNRRRTLADFRAEAIQTLGTLVLVFFIIVLGATVQPFVVFNHHCSGRASLRAYPNVFVGSDAHVPLVISGALAAVLIPALFLTICIWATWNVSGRTASGDTEFLRSFRFLFGRFHHEAYYYSLVQLTRNTLLSMVPVMMRSPAGGQLLLCMLVITLPMIIQIKVAPWRIHHINYLETICLAGLLQILAFGLLLAQAPTDTRALQRVFLAVFLGLLLVVVAFLLWATVWAIRPRTRFAFFVCHAKGDAGTRARALQLKLEQKSRWPKDTFIDADHLFNLDTLFETVRSDVRNLVVFLSGMTLNRPWCAGEIATAVRNNVPIIVVRASDFMAPDLDGEPEGNIVEARASGPQRSSMVRSLFSRGSRRSVGATEPQKCPMADFFDYATSGLAQYEITPPDILSAYRKLLEMDCIITRPRLGNTEMEHLADTILSWSKNVQGYKAMPKAVGTVAKKFTGSQAISAIASRTRSLAISATGSRGTATSMQKMPSGNSLGTASIATATSLSSNQSQRAKIHGTVALLTEAGDAEGAAGAMILFQLLLPFLDDTCFIQVDKGMSPPPLQDLLDYLNTPGSSANACHTAVILLSRSCLTSPETLAVILAAMRRFRNKDLNIVSVALPGFAYPGADFYDIELPARIETLPEHLRGPPDAVKDFFKLISVPLSTHGSRSVLEAQSSEVLLRVKQGAILAKGTKAAAGDEDAGGKVKVSGSAAAYSSEASSSKWGQRSTEGVGSIPVAAEPEEQAVPAAGEQAETSDLVVAVPEDSEGPTKAAEAVPAGSGGQEETSDLVVAVTENPFKVRL